MDDDKRAPVRRIRIGQVTASVWKNDGSERAFYTVTLQRSYKDGDGTWKNGDNFNHDDLLNAAKVLERAESWICSQ